MRHPHTLLALTLTATTLAATGCHPTPYDPTTDKAAISASIQHLAASVSAKDYDGIMQFYVPGDSLFVFDVITPRQYVGAAAYRKDWQDFLAEYPGPIQATVSDVTIDTDGAIAYSHAIETITGTGKDGKPLDLTARVTDVFKKIDGKWLVVQEHASFPMDPATGKADITSKP